ncbi:NitT/TauT family transport system permease protein [Arboricoccus pini]|uniref:NitT/TauT family transport system permease protein n=1 Tax=Arboricoccus pini TaxID=1963835 RepID=A0A212RQP0_9PROT|nr:ABC transporter permease subunit [Arboricoccus pini]SNB74923.1 NitT/TauT family transport system permease protein [Arboricoccus pini]
MAIAHGERARAPLAPASIKAAAGYSLPTFAAVIWFALGAVTFGWPQAQAWPYTLAFALGATGLGLLVLLSALLAQFWPPLAQRVRTGTPWIALLGGLFLLWEILTAKLALLPVPFFQPPQSLLEVFLEDYQRLGESVLRSVWLLARGYLIGAVAGVVLGMAMGWSPKVNYWSHPILRFIGPLPATAWLPLAFFIFPTSASASVFLIALATGFPVAILTWSGVASVSSAYYDIARTLGANSRFLILKVALPAAMPHIFVGLFMGLGASFAVLVVAEMMGVKAGLGWYLQWAQGWAAYNNMYAGLLVMALMCSGLVALLFRLRDRLLAWQKGLVRW